MRPDLTALTEDQRATLDALTNALPGLTAWHPEARREVFELLEEAAVNLPESEPERLDRQLVFHDAARHVLAMSPPVPALLESED
jgi:hypothetical protein